MAICWERAVLLAFLVCCFNFSAVLVVRVPFPFGVWGRIWNSIVSVPDHCVFINFIIDCCRQKRALRGFKCSYFLNRRDTKMM